MKILTFLLTSSILFTFATCKTKSETSATSVKPANNAANVYSLVVSFYSIGTGTDYQSKKKFDEMVKNFEDTHKKKVPIENYPWGREGELDMCINLKTIPKKQAEEFVNNVKKIAEEGQNIRVTENAECTKKR